MCESEDFFLKSVPTWKAVLFSMLFGNRKFSFRVFDCLVFSPGESGI